MNILRTSSEIRALKLLFDDELDALDSLPGDQLREQVMETLRSRREEEPENSLILATVAHDLRRLLDTRVLH